MAEQQSNFKVEAVLNNQKQQKLHPAADVFLNHQLSWIDNESWKLHQSTNHLRANS
jgi:Holliday junction resolvase-like predicted endonuclease